MKHSKRPPTQTPADALVTAVTLELRNLQSRQRDCSREMSTALGDPQKRERMEELGRERVQLEALEQDIQQRLKDARYDRYRQERDRRGAETRAVVLETCVATLRLQAVNRKREKLFKEVRGKTDCGIPGEISSSLLLGTGEMGNAADIYVRKCIEAGFLTKSDVAQVRAEVGED